MIDLTKIKSNDLPADIRFLRLLAEESQTNIYINIPLDLIEDELDISHSTMKNYLKMFKQAGFLKFVYNRNIIVNPEIFQARRGTERNIELAVYNNYRFD